jgi:hypothetical protein
METKTEVPKLVVEFNEYFKGDVSSIFSNGNRGVIMITPPIDENYWVFRVKLHKDQAIVGFPKFTRIGVGFAKEKDWNTNLPSGCEAEKIYNHIKCNKKYKAITPEQCIEAIKLIQKAVKDSKY